MEKDVKKFDIEQHQKSLGEAIKYYEKRNNSKATELKEELTSLIEFYYNGKQAEGEAK